MLKALGYVMGEALARYDARQVRKLASRLDLPYEDIHQTKALAFSLWLWEAERAQFNGTYCSVSCGGTSWSSEIEGMCKDEIDHKHLQEASLGLDPYDTFCRDRAYFLPPEQWFRLHLSTPSLKTAFDTADSLDDFLRGSAVRLYLTRPTEKQ